MIDTTLERWHRYLRGDLEGGLDVLLHEDCVFLSPIVFTPQRGKELTKLYLQAAGATFTEGAPSSSSSSSGSSSKAGSAFHYVKEVASGHHAILEFETEIDGTYVNGVDIITCDDEGLIVEFKVMLRPLRAVNLMHAQMKAMLDSMNG